MDIHNLTPDERIETRPKYYRLDFPFAYGISLGEFRCNHRCRMCPMYSHPVEKERLVSDEVVEKAAWEFGDRSHSFEISAYGETFQHPKADEYLVTVRKHCPNAQIVVATNGTLLGRERCERIVDSGINHLSFSLDAGSAASYEWLTGDKNYENACRNLENLVTIRDKRKATHLRITTHIIGIKELAHEFEPFLKRWSPVVDQAYVRTYGNWAGMVENNGVTPADHQRIPPERYPCAWLWYSTKIEPNGDVSKCFVHVTGDKQPLGNILNRSFVSIWQGDAITRLRELHLRNVYQDVEFCRDCIVWSLFPNFWGRNNGKWY